MTTWNPYFYSVGGRFLTRWSSDITSRLILSKNKLRRYFQFLTKIMGLPLWKSQYVYSVKLIFFSLGSLVFYLDGQQALSQGPFVSKQAKMKIPIFDLTHGLTLLKDTIWWLYKIHMITCFITRWSSFRLIFVQKQANKKFPIFLQNHELTLLKDLNVSTVKINICIV